MNPVAGRMCGVRTNGFSSVNNPSHAYPTDLTQNKNSSRMRSAHLHQPYVLYHQVSVTVGEGS